MSSSSAEITIDYAEEQFRRSCTAQREELLQLSRSLDPSHPKTLIFITKNMISLNFSPIELGLVAGVTRTTVGRWAQSQNVPRAVSYRKWVVEELVRYLASCVQSGPHVVQKPLVSVQADSSNESDGPGQ